MRSSQLLLLCLASASARESISNQLNIGICRSPSWPSLPLLQDPGVCSREAAASRPDLDLASIWTHTSPCYGNGTTEFCVYSSSTFAENRGITVLTTAQRAMYIAQKPAFTNPEVIKGVNQDLVRERELNYDLVEMPGKGIGVVAKKFLNRGDHIISNTASVIIDYAAFESVPEAEIYRLQAIGIDYLPSQHRSRFLNLSTHSQTEGYEKKVEKLLTTNAFDIEFDDDSEYGLFVVFPESKLVSPRCLGFLGSGDTYIR